MGIISKITTYVKSVQIEGEGQILKVVGKSSRGAKDGNYQLNFTSGALKEVLHYEHMEYTITVVSGFKKKNEIIKPGDNIQILMESKSGAKVMLTMSMERFADLAEGANPARNSVFMTYEDQENNKAGLRKGEHVVLMIQHVHDESWTDMKKLLAGKQIIILLTGK